MSTEPRDHCNQLLEDVTAQTERSTDQQHVRPAESCEWLVYVLAVSGLI